MVKKHTIKLDIRNDTPFPMTYFSSWFDSGRVADKFSFPKLINKSEFYTVILYERDWSLAGCSGYVQYSMNGNIVTIAFSNPSVGTNKVGVGVEATGKEVWDYIDDHDYEDFQTDIKVGGFPIIVHCKCSGGTTNSASVVFRAPYSMQDSFNKTPPYNPYPTSSFQTI